MRLKPILLAVLAGVRAGAAPPMGMELVPAGSYASPWQGGQVTAVAAYYLDTEPVTNGDFLAFVRANPSWRRSRVASRDAEAGYLARWSADLEPGAQAPLAAPVVEVSWSAATAFASWRGQRLPTTAEWERAAAVGFTTMAGRSEPAYRAAELDWFSVPTPAILSPAASVRANRLGIRGLTGLVWEWVADFGTTLPAGASCAGAGEGVNDFSDYPAFMRAAFRSSLRAAEVAPSLGFRCARSLVAERSAGAAEEWTDDAGRPFAFAGLHGHPVVVAMIFTRCGYTCPLLVGQLQDLERAMPEDLRRGCRFVLVSFDSAHDTPEVLRAYRAAHGLDDPRWALLHGGEPAVRRLAQTLGVNYRASGAGMFVHTSQVTILNAQGEIAWQRPTLSGSIQSAIQAIGAAD